MDLLIIVLLGFGVFIGIIFLQTAGYRGYKTA
jgi:hypothetical protein